MNVVRHTAFMGINSIGLTYNNFGGGGGGGGWGLTRVYHTVHCVPVR